MKKISESDFIETLTYVIPNDADVIIILSRLWTFANHLYPRKENFSAWLFDIVDEFVGPDRTLIYPAFTFSFGKTKILAKELKLYKEISELDGYEKNIVTKIVEEAKKRRESLDDKEIFNEQTKLINRINKIVGKGTYDNFVPNYKNLASIYQIFNDSRSISSSCLSPVTTRIMISWISISIGLVQLKLFF